MRVILQRNNHLLPSILKMQTIRGAIHSYTEGDYKPSFLSDEELKRLILQVTTVHKTPFRFLMYSGTGLVKQRLVYQRTPN